jgi:hypothetical protein
MGLIIVLVPVNRQIQGAAEKTSKPPATRLLNWSTRAGQPAAS